MKSSFAWIIPFLVIETFCNKSFLIWGLEVGYKDPFLVSMIILPVLRLNLSSMLEMRKTRLISIESQPKSFFLILIVVVVVYVVVFVAAVLGLVEFVVAIVRPKILTFFKIGLVIAEMLLSLLFYCCSCCYWCVEIFLSEVCMYQQKPK